MPEEIDQDAAYALAVVSAQKEPISPVEVTGSSETVGADAKQGAYAFKAGSALPEDRIEALSTNQVFLVRYRDELYAITPEDLQTAFPELAAEHAVQFGTIDLRDTLQVQAAFTRSAVPELIRSVGSNNVVRYDGQFYVVPQQLGEVRWGEEDLSARPGMVVASTAREAFAIAESQLSSARSAAEGDQATNAGMRRQSASVPRLVKAVEDYNIVDYEGWYYGLPHSLGSIDLETVDVIEMPGVIRDVSMDVVEKEIQELQLGKPHL